MFLTGRGTQQDDLQALVWYRKAAEQGLAAAQDTLGGFYQAGRGGVAQDDKQAACGIAKRLSKAIAPAQDNLGNMYLNGHGVPQGYRQAVEWYRKAAEQGYAPAQHDLAVCTSTAAECRRTTCKQLRGIARRPRKATSLPSTTSASATSTAAAYRRMIVRQWSGIARRLRKALPPVKTTSGSCTRAVVVACQRTTSWRRSGIAKRQSKALPMRRLNLGNLYLEGRGVPQDDALAYMLFSLRRRRETRPLRARASVAQRLSPKLIEKANELAKMWRPGTPLPTRSGVASK